MSDPTIEDVVRAQCHADYIAARYAASHGHLPGTAYWNARAEDLGKQLSGLDDDISRRSGQISEEVNL